MYFIRSKFFEICICVYFILFSSTIGDVNTSFFLIRKFEYEKRVTELEDTHTRQLHTLIHTASYIYTYTTQTTHKTPTKLVHIHTKQIAYTHNKLQMHIHTKLLIYIQQI